MASDELEYDGDSPASTATLVKRNFRGPHLTAMEQILEAELDKAAVGQPEGEAPVVTCHVLFDESQQISGAVKRGPIPRTYVLGQAMVKQEPGQRPQVIEGKIAEVVFMGADIKRLVFERDVAVQLLGGRKIWTPPR